MTDSPSLTDASAGPNSQRLKKRPAKRGTLPAIASPLASTSTTVLGQASQARVEDRGWASDPQTPNGNAASTAREKKRRKVTKQPSAASQSTMRERKGKEILELSENEKTPAPANNNQGKKLNWTVLPATLPTEVALSRNSSLSKRSITSAASAPGGLSAHLPLTIHPATPVKHTSSGSGLHRRAMSLDSNPTSNTSSNTIPKSKSSKGHKKVLSNAGHPPIRRGGVDTTRTNGEPSLMSIVEGVAGQNRASRALQDPNSMLFLPKAPPPVSQSIDFDELAKPADDPATPTIQKRKPKQDKREGSPAIVRNSSERSVPITPSVSAPVAPIVHVPSPKLKPLRSALRNTSRSPSPDLSLSAPLPPSLSKRHFLSDGPAPAPQVELTQEGQSEDHDDESSVSSYETTREALDDDEVDETNHIDRVLSSSPPSETSPPPPPPKTDVPTAAMGGSESSQTSGSTATTSTAIGTQPTRRKSVRMSLPPTFSTTPPALDDDSDGDRGRKHEPWSSPRRRSSGFGSHTESHSQAVGWSSRIKDPAQKDHDTWKDSSEEEDEEYGKAKRLLSRFSTGKKNH
ncbi:hypothetical protein EW026_g6509 [Hermanssonia centrifuga]|uniref:Uncharacterized protein n=1 Tax=Hermanssonia centrifuga TaxID=98765 RepID=A0A4S4KAV0_9APHY|nr:hypothetical protein EW026_g6509 [Hermanssonia centrifuga]